LHSFFLHEQHRSVSTVLTVLTLLLLTSINQTWLAVLVASACPEPDTIEESLAPIAPNRVSTGVRERLPAITLERKATLNKKW
jgi:hypothetical protein